MGKVMLDTSAMVLGCYVAEFGFTGAAWLMVCAAVGYIVTSSLEKM